ncbi:putative pyridoxine 4-dehydrogenase [Microsporum canis]|uniref:Pyridoxal reductase n=1 Tax=Arthroderma otae (strain ATCC MYA-4605 / CBS 113480) TaxID=554155 RepID=C5G1B3_ARTOC|nr:pyridoxal reductase [Microsporum canis CBS 113480]EEQ28576.1 pyridoxal reductase [Microsporum canis CBS 113480]
MTTILGKPVGKIGYGLMGFTWTPNPTTYEDAFKVMKVALEQGANFWNGGELYGPPDANSLQLLREYFTRYPEDTEKVVLSIKGGMGKDHTFDGTEKGVRPSVENCVRLLGGTKKIDIFECARVDKSTPIEETMRALLKMRNEGLIGGIGLSEVRAETIRRAAKVAPIAAVEIELSLWSTGPTKNGILDACREFGIPVVAYSPLGRGFLTGQIKSPDDLPDGDRRRNFPRFQSDTIEANIRLVKALEGIAKEKGVTLPQIAISWVLALEREFNVPIVPIPGSTRRERVLENTTVVPLAEADMAKINLILSQNPVEGERYDEQVMRLSDG